MDISRQIITRICKNNKKSNKPQVKGACCTNNIVQKCLSLAVSLFLVLGMVPQNAFGIENHTEDADGNWTINTVQGLVEFRDAVNGGNNFSGKIVKLAADLDVSSVSPWAPIGTSDKPFKGTFEGNGHKITGLHLNGSQDYQGLFGYVNRGTVENLTLEGVTCDEGSGEYVGGLCGYYYDGSTISNCTVTGNINSGRYVGGIAAGGFSSKFSNCMFDGSVTASGDRVGGICADGDAISNCTVTGDINGNNEVGGICGYSSSGTVTISNCTFSGTVTGSDYSVGGICGDSNGNVNISNCKVTGNINASRFVGGICGDNQGSSSAGGVTACIFDGSVTAGGEAVGGICGYSYGSGISNCTVTGNINGGEKVGGIYGFGSGSAISNCAVTGTINGTNNVGGVTGLTGEISECASFANVSGNVSVGGISGSCSSCINCYATGHVSGESEIGGIVGGPTSSSNANNVTSSYFGGTLSGAGYSYSDGNKRCYIGGINGYDISGANKKCFCLSQSIEGSDDPDVDNIKAFISALYLQDKPGGTSPSYSYPAITDNDDDCFYRADLGDAPGIGYDGEPIAIEPGWQQKFVDIGWDENVWNIPPTDPSSPDYSLSALPTLKNIPADVEQNPKVPGVVDSTPTEEESSEEEKSGDSQNSHPEWGEREIHGGIIHYVNAEGMTSVEISAENTDANGIVWLREESDGTAAWYGVDNSARTFESGSRFYVQWLNTTEHPEAFADIDEEIRQQVEENRGWLFKIGVIAPDGTRYSTLSNPVNVYVQIGDDWDKGDLQGFYVQQGADENVEVSYVEGWPYPEGTDEFGVMQLNHFSPYFIYDKDEAKPQNPATNDECHMFIFLVMSGVLTGVMFITFAKLLSIRRKNGEENYFTNTLI